MLSISVSYFYEPEQSFKNKKTLTYYGTIHVCNFPFQLKIQLQPILIFVIKGQITVMMKMVMIMIRRGTPRRDFKQNGQMIKKFKYLLGPPKITEGALWTLIGQFLE